MSRNATNEKQAPTLRTLARSEALPVILLIALWLVMFGGYLFSGDAAAPGIPNGDARTQWVCWREFGFGSISEGLFPSWNPHVLCGVPFLASWQSAPLYPPNLIFAATPLHRAARISLLAHMAFAAVSAYALARYLGAGRMAALAAAIGYSFAAPQLLKVFAGHWGAVCAAGWSPLILLGLEALIRKPTVGRAMLGGVAAALQLLSGAPQYAAYAWLMALVYLIARLAFGDNDGKRKPAPEMARTIIFAGLMFVFGVLLAAPQVMPAAAAMPFGARAMDVRPEWAEAFSLHPTKLVTLFSSGVFGDDIATPYWGAFNIWEMSGFSGGLVFALGAAGLLLRRDRRKWALASCACVMLLFALGRHIPPLFALYRALPGMGGLRGASKFLANFSLLFCMLAGLGLHALASADRKTLLRFALGCGAAAGLFIAVAFAPWGDFEWWRGMRDFFDMTRTEGALEGRARLSDTVRSAAGAFLRSAFWLVALGGIAALLSRVKDKQTIGGIGARGALAAALILALVAAEMVSFGWKYTRPEQGFDAYAQSIDVETAEFLREKSRDWRVWIIGHPALNDPMRMGLHTFEGVEPNPPLAFHHLFAAAVRQPSDIPPSIYQATRLSPLWNLMAARYIVFAEPPDLPPHGMELIRDGAHPVYENADALPRAFIVHRHITDYHGGRSSRIHPEAVDYSREVIIFERPAEEVPIGRGAPTADQARIVEETPARVVIEAELTEAGWLVLSDNYFPGWSAEANGEPAHVHLANHAFRAVRLGPGAHRVVFQYRPIGFSAGIGACAIALLLAALYLARVKRSN